MHLDSDDDEGDDDGAHFNLDVRNVITTSVRAPLGIKRSQDGLFQ